MANGDFSRDLAKLVEKAKGDINLVHRKVCLDLYRSLVLKSPVDTGRFRGNWQVGVGSVNVATTTGTDKDGGSSISRAQGALENVPVGGVIYLTNSLPYAVKLEYGHSKKQAPDGMVRVTIAEYSQFLAKVIAEVKS